MIDTSAHRRRVSMADQAKKYRAWWEDMQGFASKHNNISGLTQLVSMWNPVIGFGLDVANRAYQKHNMPDEYEGSFLYTPVSQDMQYDEGSKDALLELEAGMWSGLMSHLGKSAMYHGVGGMKEAFGDIKGFGGKVANFGKGLLPEGSPDIPGGKPRFFPDLPDLPKPDEWFPDIWPDFIPRESNLIGETTYEPWQGVQT